MSYDIICPKAHQIDNKQKHLPVLTDVKFIGEAERTFTDPQGNYHNHSKTKVVDYYRCLCGKLFTKVRVNMCTCGWINGEET